LIMVIIAQMKTFQYLKNGLLINVDESPMKSSSV